MAGKENDRAFEAVLQNTGNIDAFLDEFFSFLARRTDFFVESPPDGGQIGFPPGVAAKLIISKFKKWQEFRAGRSDSSSGTRVDPVKNVPEPVVDMEVSTSPKPKKPSQESSFGNSKEAAFPIGTFNPGGVQKAVSSPCEKAPNPADSYNGQRTDKYSWSQSIKELDVSVFVGETVKSKHDIQVEIQPNRIRVVVPSAKEPVVVDWTLPERIVKDESYWSLHPGESVIFCLQKAREKWWDHIFEGENPLDRTKIEAVRPMEDLDEEEQAKIQELMWNQEQKLKGLPTSEELKLQDTLKKAWDAEGSPFKGQPFDPSLVRLANNSIGSSNDVPLPPS